MRRDQEQLIESGTEEMASVFAGLFNLAIRIERERFLRAGHYERSSERRGYANGSKPKKLDTPAGTVGLQVPKTAGHEEPFYPQAWSAAGAPAAPSCWRWRRCTSKASQAAAPRR